MTDYKFGTIVLLNFPHTNLQQSSKRPALVIYDEGDKDLVVARITSQPYSGKNDHKISDWKDVGLLFPSWVRAGKIATLDKQLIIRTLGELKQNDCAKIGKILKQMFTP